jgi:ABC-type Zn uptake system ZnuABC Zn-binding protein ZnuA
MGLLVVTLGLAATGCRDDRAPSGSADVAVTNSYLASAVRDVCGDGIEVVSLAPPGMCPGHFDLSPAQIGQLRRCKLLLLFGFQQQVEQKVARLKADGLNTGLVETPPGLCLPETYMAACRQVARLLTEHYPDRAERFDERLAAIERRLAALSGALKSAVGGSPAASATVLTSHHQAKFAEWLGLDPVATCVGSDAETMSNVDHCLRQADGRDVRFVIANRQEGTALAEALADRLQARAVEFSNFPPAVAGGASFDRLLENNVQALLEAARR